METKKCIKCGVIKPLDQFYKHPKMKSGYKNSCIACNKLYIKEYYKRDDPERSEKLRLYGLNRIGINKADKAYKFLFPEKCLAQNAAGNLPKEKGKHKHHWNYRQEYWKDIIYLTPSEHKLAHYYMYYDQERMMYRRLDGTLIDSKEKHIEYIKSLI